MKIFMLLCWITFVCSIQKIVSKRGVCIGTAGKICSENDLKVCIRINGRPVVFQNQCKACQENIAMRVFNSPMTDYMYCYENEAQQECCAGLR